MQHEVWRQVTISWARHFEVSSIGRVRNTRTGRIRKLTVNKEGRAVVSLSNGINNNKVFLVHRLVALAFHGKPKPGQECRHLDGNQQNNRAENLRWGTSLENGQDMVRQGTASRGENRPGAKLTTSDVMEIRLLNKQGQLTHQAIANRFGVCRSVVTNIINVKTWRHVPTAIESGIAEAIEAREAGMVQEVTEELKVAS